MLPVQEIDPCPRLRSAVPSDLPGLVRLEASSFNGDRLSRRSFRRCLRDQRAVLLVIECGSRPGLLWGYALVLGHVRGRVARLYSLAVDPSMRGRGLGGELLAACVAEARERGFEELRLEVAEANAPALALYRKAGFEPFARRSRYYDDGSDALRLRCLL